MGQVGGDAIHGHFNGIVVRTTARRRFSRLATLASNREDDPAEWPVVNEVAKRIVCIGKRKGLRNDRFDLT